MSSRVLLVVIDAATAHVVCPAIQTGRLPTMQRLAEVGSLHWSSTSIFPSITPAATSSIITGAYPAGHGIAGAAWFDADRGEVAYYGDDFWVILREGFGHFVNDFLLRLNGDRMRAPTLFEMVERTGRRAACLNYLVFKGRHPHRVTMPGLMAALPGVPFTETVEGPSLLSLGDFVGTHTPRGKKLDDKSGVMHRFGMDDESTGAMLRDLAAEGSLPDLTVAYFADNDFVSHDVGPVAALPIIERVDRMLGDVFEAAGGLDRFLQHTAVIITSDHGHCDIRPSDRAITRLDHVLADFRQADLGTGWKRDDEVLICPNMRAAQIYFARPSADVITRLATTVLMDPNVDQVIWRSELTGGRSGYTVLTHRGRLEFCRAENAAVASKLPLPARGAAEGRAPEGRPDTATDAFGTTWTWRGEVGALGVQVDGPRVHFVDYPNAFERIAGVLDLDMSGEVWVTAKPGCEFEAPGGKAHRGGGSHGALHALDSNSPLIVAGGAAPAQLPVSIRSVDVAPLCMEILGIPMRYRLTEGRDENAKC